MQYYILTPSVYGQLGNGTVIDKGSHEVVRPILMIEEVPKEDLMSAGGANIFVSIRLADALQRSGLSGYQIDKVAMYKSPQFDIVNPRYEKNLPEYRWLRIVGGSMQADFYRHENYMAVSETALAFLRTFTIQNCDVIRIEEFPMTWEERKKLLFQKARQRIEESGSANERS